MDLMADVWELRTVRLPIRIGEFTLAAPGLRLLVRQDHFTERAAGFDETALPLHRLPRDADGFLLRSQPVAAAPARLERRSRFVHYVPSHYERYYIDLSGTFDEYLRKFSSKSRSTLQRKVRKFAEHSGGQIAWREFRGPDEMAEFHRLAREVSAKTYQERLLDAGIPAGDDFLRDLVARAERGDIAAYILFHEGRAVAYLCCPAVDGVLLYQYLGYDPAYSMWSPGTVLQYLALESLFARGAYRMFDFTEGEGPHKQFFATGSTHCADIYYLRRTPRIELLLGLRTGTAGFSDACARLLDSLGLKSRLKRLLRARA